MNHERLTGRSRKSNPGFSIAGQYTIATLLHLRQAGECPQCTYYELLQHSQVKQLFYITFVMKYVVFEFSETSNFQSNVK